MEIDQLVNQLEKYNRAYRSGRPLVDDATYDQLVEQLRSLDPHNPFLKAVEPEAFTGRREVRHPAAMLSTEKAYTHTQLERFFARVEKNALALGIEEVLYRVTPKLDGLAGRDDGNLFASRGNGLVGYDISNAFDKGVIPIGGRGQGLGEIVVVQSYFEANLADKFEHPRNMVVGIISSDTLNEDARQALDDGKVRFVPYSQLSVREENSRVLLENIDQISEELKAKIDYPLDGMVVEVVDERLKEHMGATTHHYRWQIAVKRKGETAETTVQGIQWQVGRTGNVTPVMEVDPIPLSGATIRRVTAHHAGMIAKLNIGPGARIEVIRSGEVIPKLEGVIEPAAQIELPQICPACSEALEWKGDFLRCGNSSCPAQITQRLSHWFRTLGNADWFGIKTIEKLVAGGYDTLEKIYAMGVDDFSALGFGPVQSQNLAEALIISRTKAVEDWRFLAAFGIADLGVGDSRRLLEQVPLEELPNISEEAIAQINGFGQITSRSIVRGIDHVRHTMQAMLALGFNLERTPLVSETPLAESAISGKNIVFTGKMQHGSREAMQAGARQLGAKVQTALSKNTNLLVCGIKAGPSKLNKADQLGVKILTEQEYYELIGQ